MKIVQSVEEALAPIQSGHRVFVQGEAATPIPLLEGLVAQAGRLRDVELMHLHTEGGADYADPKYKENFRVANLFVGPNIRKQIDHDRIDYLPCFLSEIGPLLRSGRRPVDVAIVTVSPPDKHGYCSLGVSVDVAVAGVEAAPVVIAQINPHMPRVHGDGIVHVNDIDLGIEIASPLPEAAPRKLTDDELAIGRHCAELIEDGSTLQMGIGAVPDAVLAALKDHRHMGIHTEMYSDGILPLVESGAIDNSRKNIHPGKIVGSFTVGTRKLYDFIDDNPSVVHLESAYVNRPDVIRRNERVVAINSAVEVDLTGQVCADSVGSRIISGVGGQMDFIRGASLSKGGKPIIALTSRSAKGQGRIVPQLMKGAGVVTTRAHVHYIVTEYGVADLYGKTLTERAKALIAIAHPEEQDRLERAWYEDWRNL